MKPSGLNHVYRVVWCASKGVWQAVNELSRTRTRNNSRSVVRKLVAGTGAALLAGGQALAAGLPEHGQITAGSGSISQSGNHMVIDQSSDRMAINWQNFSIGADNSVTFQQPGQSAIALNRVVGHERSVIDGALNANGQVWLLNANGVLFNSSAQINTAGLVASTLDISDDDFMAGKSTFAANGSAASVINLGSITTIDEGYVALLGQQVINEGVITARLGTAALASGDQVTLNFNGNSLVGVTIDRAALNALVENRHAVFADGGMVILTAQGLDEVMATVVNNTGEIRAAGIEEREGRVFLTGIGDYAQTEQRGRVDVSSASGRGGRVEIAGAQVGLWDGAEVDASGATGGGRVLIGGDYQGANPDVTNAKRTFVAAGASVNVDATEQGDGGTAIVWADDITRFNGHISARGGEQGGDGGFVEVSGKDSLIYRGTVDASAAHGAAGQLLLDPKNITIANAGADPADSGSNGFADNAADDVTIDPAAIAALLNAGISVTLQANNDISVVDSLTADATSHAGATVLAMEAGRSISISALMQLFGIDAEFYANHPGADADNRDAGPAVFNNVGFIQARNVDIKIGAGADTGNINTGTIQAVDLNIEHLGESGQVNLGGLTLTNSLTVNASEHDLTVFSAPAASLLQTGSGGVTINAGAGIVDLFNTNISLLSLTAHLAEVTNSQPLSLAAVTILARDAGVTKGQFDLTVTGPVQQSSGHMDIDGTFNFRALQGGFGIQPNDVTFNSSANMFRGDINVLGGRNVTLRSDNHNLSFGSDGVNISGLLTLTTNQDVIFDPASIISIGSSSRFTLNGSTTTDMTGATNISNNIRDFFVSRARDVTLVTQAQSNLILGTSTTANAVTGNLNVTANNMSVNNLRVQGDLALTTHGSSIAQQANNTRMEVGGNLNVTTHTADTDLFLGDRDLSALTHTNSIGGTSTLNTVGTGSWRDIRYRNTATGAGMILGLEGETLRHLAVQLNNPGASIALPTLTLTGGGQTVRLGFDDQSTATFYLETGNATTTVTQAGPLVFDNATAVARFRTGANTTLSLTADNLFRRLRIDDASNIDLVNTVALSLQTVKSRNDFDLELRGEGDIQRDSGALDVAGDASFVSTSGVSNFSHSTSGNSVGGALSFTGFNDVNYGGGHNLNLGETAIAGNLTLSGLGSGYQLSQSGALTVPGTVSLSLFTNGIVLDDAANALGAIGVANMGNGNVHIVENDAITQSGAWVLGSNNDIRLETVGSQAITLDNAGNSFGNITVIQRDDSAQAPGDVAIVSSNSNGIRQGSGVANAWQTFGHTLINAGGNSIDLTNPNNLFGPLQVLGGTALDRSVNLAAKGLIADYAAWNTGRTILTAYSLAGDIGQGDILLTQANTLGNLTLRGRDVTVTEADNITQQQDQAWIINGDLVLDAGANNIIVTQDGNDISRLSILNAGTAAVYDDVGDLQLLTINVADKLTLRAAGSVTQAGALQVSDLRLFGTGSANLNQVNTVDNLAVSLTGGDFNFVNSKTLNLAAIDGTDGISIGTNDVRLEVAMGTITGIAGRINQASTGLELVAETLDLPTLLIDGFITLRASDLINLGGNITATNVGELLFDGDVRITSAGAGIQISTAGSDVTFEGVLDANGKTLAFTDTSGNRRFKGAVSDLGNAAISTPGITLAVGGSTVFESTVQSNTGISADGTVEFRDDVTLGDGVAGSTFTGLVILGKAGGMDFSGFDGLRFDGGLQLQNGPSTISSNGSLLQLGGPVTGAFDLTLDAGVGENATITSGSLSNLGSEITGLTVRANALTLPGNFTIAGAQTFEVTNVNNAIQLGGDLASTAVGAITFLSDVQLTSNSSVTSVNSEIRFASNVFGAQQLDLNSGNGKVVLDGEVGGSAALSHFRSLGTGDLEMAGGLLRTTGLISSVGDLVITAASILDSDAGDISLQQIDGAHALTLNSTGTTSLAGAVNTASLSTNAGGTTAINGGAVTTSGIQSYGNAVTLGDHTDLSASSVSFAGTVTGNGHDLSISDDLTTAQALSGLGSVQVGGAASLGAGISSSGAQTFDGGITLTDDVTLDSDSGDLALSGTVDGNHSLTLNSTGNTILGGAVGVDTALTSLATSLGGTIAINGGVVTTSGAQSYGNAVTLGDHTDLNASSVSFAGTVTGNGHDLSISDDLTTAQALSGLGSVQVGGAASLGAGISSSGAQTFDGAVILTDDVTLASGSGDLALNQTVDGAHALTLNSDGTTTLGGAVNTVSLATNAGGTTALNGGAVTTSGSQAYGNTVTLGSNTALTANSVSFADTVTGNGHDLSVSDDLVTANALSGLGSLQVGGTSSLGGSVAGTGAQHYEGAVTLTNAVVLDSDTADITFDSGVSGAHALTLNSTGTTMLGGTVNTSSVMSNAGGTLVVSGGSITTTGAQTYGNDLGLTTDTTFTGENITFNGAIRSQGAEAHNLQVTDAGDAVFNGALGSSALNNVTIEANSVTLSDGDIEGDLNVTASTGAIVTQGAGVLEVGGDANLQAATGITLDGALRVVGDLLLKAQGLISQSAALEVTGTTTLDVRGAGLGDVLLANSLDTLLAETLVGGDLRIEGTDLITQVDGTTIRVRGAFDPDGATLDFDTLAENIVAVAASIGGNLIRGIGEIVLEVVGGELQASVDGNVIATGVSLVGDVFVQSLAGGLQFDGPALAGDAILLGNAANALTGEVSILTDAPDVITSVAVRTGISQVNTLSVAGTLNLLTEQSPVAGSGQITLDNADNQFGALAINGRNATISQQGTMTLRLVSIAESLSLTADAVTQVSGLAASATNLVLNVLNSASLTEANTIGAASGVIGGHLALQNQGALTLGDGVTGLSADDGMLVSISAGDLTLANQVSSVDGDLVLVAGDNFINNAGASALNVTGTGSWQVWSQEPEADALGGLVPDFIQYNANFGSSSVLGVGNGLLYTLAPELDVALVGEVRRTYDQTTDAALQQSNYQVNGGALASITFSFSSDGAYDSANAGEGKTVTVANLVLDSAVRDDNVAIFGFGLVDTTVSADIGVIDRALITAVNGIVATARQYDGTNNVTLDGHSASFTGLLSGDDLTLATLSGQFADINAGTGVQVDVTDISLGGAAASNYQLDVSVAIPVTGDILQRSLDLTGSRVYDGTTDALAADLALGNLVGTETLVLSGMGSLADRNAADGKLVNVSGLNLADGTGLASNYTFTGGTHTLDVTRREVTVSGITASDRIYDGTTDATVNIAGVLFDNIVSGDTLTVSATGTFDSRNVGSDRTVTLASSYSGADAGNYVFVDQASTTASITPRAISVSGITAQDRIYDGTTDAVVDVSGVTFANAIAGDDLQVSASGTFDSRNVGTDRTVTLVSGYSGDDVGNYVITDQAETTASITPRTVTVSGITASDRVYDGTTDAEVAAGSAVFTNIVNGDNLFVSATGAFTDRNAGTNKTVNLTSTYGGEHVGNYVFVDQASTTASIAQREVTVSGITAGDRVYDGTTVADVDVAGALFANIVDGDSLFVSATGTFDSRNVGTDRTVTLASSYSGADAGNYVFVDQASTTASITPKALTVVNLLALDKVYDGTTHASINVSLAILNGIIADDDVALAELSGQFADRNVGQNITVTTGQPTLTGEHAGNYTIEPISTLAASITPRDLAVTATALDKMFDGTLNANVTIGDNRIRLEDELLYDFTSRFVSAEPGQNRLVLVTEILLGGADAGNYRLLNTAATTFANIRPLSIFDQLPNAEQIIVDSQANAQLTAESPVTKVVPPQLLAKPSPQGPGMAPGVRFVSVNEPSASLAAQFEPGAGLQLVAQPRPGEQTATVTLSEVAEMVALPEEAGVDSSRERRRIRVPLNNRSLVDVVDGGVALPEGVEQIMFVTKR